MSFLSIAFLIGLSVIAFLFTILSLIADYLERHRYFDPQDRERVGIDHVSRRHGPRL